jgi:MFS family permease
MAFASIGWGALADRFGPRIVVLLGSVLLALSVALASRSNSLIEFQLVFGLLVGVAVAAIFAPIMATVTGWFDTHRSLAVSLVSAGMGMAPLTMSPLAAWLISRYDWRTAFLLIAVIVAALMIPLSLLVRRAPALAARTQAARAESGSGLEMSVGEAFRSPQFIVLILTNFCCCATHSGPIFHTVSYAIACGIPDL